MGRGFLERGRLRTGVAEMTEGLSSQAQRALVLDVFFPDRAVLVPEMEYGGDHHSDTQTAEEKPAVGRKPDEEGEDQDRRDDQTCSAPEKTSGRCRLGIQSHRNTLTAFYPKMARDKVAPGATLNRKGPRVRALLRNSVRNYWWAGLSAGGGAIGAIVWVVSSLICGKGCSSATTRT
jgi:hypothetical protein